MKECGCIYVDIDEIVETIKNEFVKSARKQHKCNECGRTIEIGESYEYHFYTFRGKSSFHKICEDCNSLRSVFFCEGFEYGHIGERVIEHIQEMEGNISSDCLIELTKGAREFVLDKIQNIYDDLNWGDEQE